MTQPDAAEQYTLQLASECGPVINGLYRYYNRRSIMVQPEIALFVAIEIIGIICGRIWEADPVKYRTDRGDIKTIPATTTTDYLLILAGTGAGKETVKTIMREILEMKGLNIPTPPQATGLNAIHTAAQRQPRTVIITDEAGLNRQTTGSGQGDQHGKKTVETYLMDIYASRTGRTNPQLYAEGKDNPNLKTILRNALSCVLLSTPETYDRALDSDDAHSGYLSRHVVILSTRDRVENLGTPLVTAAAEATAAAEEQAMIRPFKKWIPYHAGRPDCDIYNQLIPPSLATAWAEINDPETSEEGIATKLAEITRNPGQAVKKQGKQEAERPLYPISRGPDRVRWDNDARQALMQIYADNEAYCRKHPEAKDMLTRKLQHVMIYAMRIALANDPIGTGTDDDPLTDPQKSSELKRAIEKLKSAREAATVAKEAADKAITTLNRKKKKAAAAKTTAMQAAEENGAETPEEFGDDPAAKAAGEAAAEETATQETATKAREHAAAAAREYKQTIQAVEMAIRNIYTNNPPVITAKHVETARKIIEFAVKSSVSHLTDAIPPGTWKDAKERVLQILRDNGGKMPKSQVEARMKSYHLGEKWKDLINEMVEDDFTIEPGEPARNGGCTLAIVTPEPTDGSGEPAAH